MDSGVAVGPYNAYYDSVSPSNVLTLYYGGGNATGLTYSQVTTFPGVGVSVPDGASNVIIVNTSNSNQQVLMLATQTPTQTPTYTPTPTNTTTPTNTSTQTPTQTQTQTPSPTPFAKFTAALSPTSQNDVCYQSGAIPVDIFTIINSRTVGSTFCDANIQIRSNWLDLNGGTYNFVWLRLDGTETVRQFQILLNNSGGYFYAIPYTSCSTCPTQTPTQTPSSTPPVTPSSTPPVTPPVTPTPTQTRTQTPTPTPFAKFIASFSPTSQNDVCYQTGAIPVDIFTITNSRTVGSTFCTDNISVRSEWIDLNGATYNFVWLKLEGTETVRQFQILLNSSGGFFYAIPYTSCSTCPTQTPTPSQTSTPPVTPSSTPPVTPPVTPTPSQTSTPPVTPTPTESSSAQIDVSNATTNRSITNVTINGVPVGGGTFPIFAGEGGSFTTNEIGSSETIVVYYSGTGFAYAQVIDSVTTSCSNAAGASRTFTGQVITNGDIIFVQMGDGPCP